MLLYVLLCVHLYVGLHMHVGVKVTSAIFLFLSTLFSEAESATEAVLTCQARSPGPLLPQLHAALGFQVHISTPGFSRGSFRSEFRWPCLRAALPTEVFAARQPLCCSHFWKKKEILISEQPNLDFQESHQIMSCLRYSAKVNCRFHAKIWLATSKITKRAEAWNSSIPDWGRRMDSSSTPTWLTEF